MAKLTGQIHTVYLCNIYKTTQIKTLRHYIYNITNTWQHEIRQHLSKHSNSPQQQLTDIYVHKVLKKRSTELTRLAELTRTVWLCLNTQMYCKSIPNTNTSLFFDWTLIKVIGPLATHLALHLHGAQSSVARHSVVFVHLSLTGPRRRNTLALPRAALIRLELGPSKTDFLGLIQLKARISRQLRVFACVVIRIE